MHKTSAIHRSVRRERIQTGKWKLAVYSTVTDEQMLRDSLRKRRRATCRLFVADRAEIRKKCADIRVRRTSTAKMANIRNVSISFKAYRIEVREEY